MPRWRHLLRPLRNPFCFGKGFVEASKQRAIGISRPRGFNYLIFEVPGSKTVWHGVDWPCVWSLTAMGARNLIYGAPYVGCLNPLADEALLGLESMLAQMSTVGSICWQRRLPLFWCLWLWLRLWCWSFLLLLFLHLLPVTLLLCCMPGARSCENLRITLQELTRWI